MKVLIKNEIIVVLIAIIAFPILFTILDGWSAEDTEKYAAITVGVGIASLIFFLPAATSSTANTVFFPAVGAGIVAAIAMIAVIFVSVAEAGGVVVGAGIVTAVVAMATTAIATTNNQLKQLKGKIFLSLFVEAVVIFGSISAMVFV